jgi:hypothetical protein
MFSPVETGPGVVELSQEGVEGGAGLGWQILALSARRCHAYSLCLGREWWQRNLSVSSWGIAVLTFGYDEH